MDIVVTVKQVPDPDIPPTHFKVDEAAKKVIPPAGVAPVMNGYDAHALEAALRLKEQLGGKVTVISLGPDTARDTLAWFKSQPPDRQAKLRAGLSAEREAEVLAAWHKK